MANKKYQPNFKRGVAILFAVLLVSVVLTISLGLFNISYRQLVLSSLARESEIATAVADTARNCALYADSPERTYHPFGYYAYSNGTWSWNPADSTPLKNKLVCAGQTRPVETIQLGGSGSEGLCGSGSSGIQGIFNVSPTVGASAVFEAPTEGGSVSVSPTGQNCGGASGGVANVYARHFTVKIEMGDSNDSRQACADVLVVKSTNPNDQKTVILSNGYNLYTNKNNDFDCTPTNTDRAVQRTIQTIING